MKKKQPKKEMFYLKVSGLSFTTLKEFSNKYGPIGLSKIQQASFQKAIDKCNLETAYIYLSLIPAKKKS